MPENLSLAQADAFVEQSVTESLRRLRLAILPICLFHNEKDSRYIDSLLRMREKGRVLHVGISHVSSQAAAKNLEDRRVEAIQIPTNIFDRRFLDAGVFSLAQQNGVAVFVRSVYLQGLLLMSDEQISPELSSIVPSLYRLRALAKNAGLSMPELAVRYVLGLTGVNAILTGVETVRQMRENIRIFNNGPLPGDMMEAVTDCIKPLSENVLQPCMWPQG